MIKKILHIHATAALLILGASAAFANNIALSNPVLSAPSGGARDIQFNVAWDNSWRDAGASKTTVTANWDAAWVFAKFAVWSSTTSTWGPWMHCTLSSKDADHYAPAGATLETGCTPVTPCNSGAGTTGKGAFIYRSAANTGSTFTVTGAKLHWLYASDPIAPGSGTMVQGTDTVKIKVFGIEMVFIPRGAFWAGDNATSTASFKKAAADSTPWAVTSEGAISVDNALYYYVSAGNVAQLEVPTGTTFTIPAAFPKGYAAFYIMKADVTNQQYVNFLNTLTRVQQNIRTANRTSNMFAMNSCPDGTDPQNCVSATYYCRSAIRNPAVVTPATKILTFGCDLNNNKVFNESGDGQAVAANWVSWSDNAAYAAWAGLRPYTELEFEKAARGPQTPVSGEYAWGNTSVSGAAYTLTSSGSVNEGLTAATGTGNMNNATTWNKGPMRAGIFAASAGTKNRQETGASYYGVLDLSGNLWKLVVTPGTTLGLNFTGSHGDGLLTTTSSYEGNATNTDWPGIDPTRCQRIMLTVLAVAAERGTMVLRTLACPIATTRRT